MRAIEQRHRTRTDAAIRKPDDQFSPYVRTVHFEHVPEPATFKQNAVRAGDEVFLKEKDEVQISLGL
jgi:hypothetical protein